MNQSKLLQKTVIAAALTLAYTQMAHAQVAVEADKPIQKVIVTGSNIAHIDAETATPVTILRREDIARTGSNTVSELLSTLTSATGSLNDIGGSNSFAGGSSSASLRNLGKQSTLILLNSRRVAPYALADYSEVFTNLDSLPLDAIDRIEVLRNGGSAVYGSDAVAGVINIITRNDFRGVQVSATQDQSLKTNEFKSRKGSITGGIGDFASDGYNVLANLEVYRRDSVMWRQVVDDINPAYGDKFSAVAPGSGKMFGNRGAPSTYSFPGNIIGQGPIPGCTTISSKLCQYDRFSRFEAVPESKRVNALVSGKLRINEKVDGFAEVLYSHTETDYESAYATYGATVADAVWGDPSTGAQRTFVYRPLPATHPLNQTGDEADFRYRFADGPGREEVVSQQYRVLAGLRGNWNSYDWETAAGIMGGKTSMKSRGGFFSDSGFKQVIGDYTTDDPNFFNHDYKIGQQNSPEVLNKLFPVNGYDGKITQYFVDGKISGDIAHIGDRAVGLAVGAELRHEKFNITPTANHHPGDIVSNGASSADAHRNTGAAYAEVSVPVTSMLELDGAVRIDKYQGFDSHTSPKVAFRFTPFKQLLVRGTVESGFRAPNLTESAQSSKFAFNNGVQDPKRCPQALALAQDLRARADAGDPDAALLNARADDVEGRACAAGVASNVRNNPNLKPETSRSATLGFVLEPVKGYTLSVDYWHIERKDEIGLKSTQELLAAENAQPPGTIVRNPLSADKTFTPAEQAQYGVTVGSLASTSGMFENVSKTKTSGVDVSGSARIPTRFGKVTLDGNATYLLDLRTFSTTRNGYGDNLAGRYVEASGTYASKVVANATLALESGNFTNSLRATFHSRTELRGDFFDEDFTTEGCADRGWTASECKLASYVRWDYSLTYRGFKGWTVNGFVRNVFNHRPPVDLRTFATQGSVIPQDYEDVQGRMLRVTAEYRF